MTRLNIFVNKKPQPNGWGVADRWVLISNFFEGFRRLDDAVLRRDLSPQ